MHDNSYAATGGKNPPHAQCISQFAEVHSRAMHVTTLTPVTGSKDLPHAPNARHGLY